LNKIEIYTKILECGIMPTTFVYDIAETCKLAQTLYDGGIHIIELLQRTPQAREALSAVKKAVPEMIVGAGTVLTVKTAEEAVQCGTDYVVSPFYDQNIVDWCCDHNVAVVPGCATITEVSRGYNSGLRCFKYFPVKQLGGAEVIRQISEIYNDARYVVTGGITFDDLTEYAQSKYVGAIGSVCMMPQELINAHQWTQITQLTKKAVAASLGFELAYVKADVDTTAAGLLSMICDFSLVRSKIPDVPAKVKGNAEGYIAGIYTNSIVRALAYFRRHGIVGKVLTNEKDGTPVVAEIEIPAWGKLQLIARHYIYRT